MWLSESDCQLYEQIFELRVEDGSKKIEILKLISGFQGAFSRMPSGDWFESATSYSDFALYSNY